MQPLTDAPAIRITDRAIQQLLQVAADEHVDLGAAYLRVAVVPGGCSGLTYDLGWDSAQHPGDTLTELGALRVVMDLNTSLYIEGTELDFTDGLDGQGFHFLNPQATRTCACGESFGV
ncbi:MAG: iron-sulfur cluster assembly accessory protein [Bacteroidota bacterium]